MKTLWVTRTAPNGVQYRAPNDGLSPLGATLCTACHKPGRLGRPVRRGRHAACNYVTRRSA